MSPQEVVLGKASQPVLGGRTTFWQKWVHRPRGLLFRKILFYVHLWIGIAVGLYVAVISISGSAIVCRREIDRFARRRVTIVAGASRPRMRPTEIEQDISRAYTGYQILSFRESEQANEPDVAVLERRNYRIARLFDPYTGADLGDPQPAIVRLLGWLADLHDNLLAGLTGRALNGIGAALIVIMSVTGAVLWWPGIRNWQRGIRIQRGTRVPRLNWDLHNAVGFWSFLFVLVWGASGICLCFPGILDFILSYRARVLIVQLHFGRFNGATEALWIILGLAPAILATTGALMWWNRFARKRLRRMF